MNLFEKIIGTVAPFECMACGVEGKILCEACSVRFCQTVPSRCYLCRSATEDFKVCKRCRKSSNLKRVLIRTELEGLPRHLLHIFKFDRVQSAAPTIASLMSEILVPASEAIIVPISSATSRIRERGYDHAKLIGRELAHLKGLPSINALKRLNQFRQVGTKREQRLVQLKGAFRVSPVSFINNAHIILVDDVVTTGSTLESAAQALKLAGAGVIDAIVFAQK